jgi:hypothetical protein
MPTFNLDLRYRIASLEVTTDLTTDSPSVEVYVVFKNSQVSIGTFTFAELRLLTGTSTAYNEVTAMATNPPADPDGGYAEVRDQTINNEVFVQWAQGFPNSPFTPYLAGLFPRP